MNAKAVLTAAAGKIAASLKARGYVRRGLTFVRQVADGFVSMIELQPSRKSTPEELSFVINFGVIVPKFFLGDDLTKPEYSACHWGSRVSGEDGVEVWWHVRADENPEQLATRVTALIEREVLPALEAKQGADELIALWKTGRSPLLVDSQRLLFLGKLLHSAGRRAEFEQVKAELEGKATNSFSLRALSELKELDG